MFPFMRQCYPCPFACGECTYDFDTSWCDASTFFTNTFADTTTFITDAGGDTSIVPTFDAVLISNDYEKYTWISLYIAFTHVQDILANTLE